MPATKIYVDKEEPRFVTVDFPSRESGREFYRLATKHGGFEFGAGSGGGSSDISFEFPSVSAAKAFVRDVNLSSPSAKMVHNPKRGYEENPTQAANILLGAGLGGLTGGLFFGPLGALIVGGTFAALGSYRDIFGDGRKFLENPRCPRGMQVQTLIFGKDNFTRAQAAAWARRNNFRATKVDSTTQSYRIRQRAPSSFTSGSFRTIALSDRVSAVIGCPRR